MSTVPTPTPIPAPAPVPVPVAKPWYLEVLTPAAITLVALVALYLGRTPPSAPEPQPPPVPASTTDGVALGRSYAPVLASTYGDGWIAAAAALRSGKTVSESMNAHQDAWLAARQREFTARVSPTLARVLPEGTEPRSPEEREKVAAFWESFARGLKGN